MLTVFIGIKGVLRNIYLYYNAVRIRKVCLDIRYLEPCIVNNNKQQTKIKQFNERTPLPQQIDSHVILTRVAVCVRSYVFVFNCLLTFRVAAVHSQPPLPRVGV